MWIKSACVRAKEFFKSSKVMTTAKALTAFVLSLSLCLYILPHFLPNTNSWYHFLKNGNENVNIKSGKEYNVELAFWIYDESNNSTGSINGWKDISNDSEHLGDPDSETYDYYGLPFVATSRDSDNSKVFDISSIHMGVIDNLAPTEYPDNTLYFRIKPDVSAGNHFMFTASHDDSNYIEVISARKTDDNATTFNNAKIALETADKKNPLCKLEYLISNQVLEPKNGSNDSNSTNDLTKISGWTEFEGSQFLCEGNNSSENPQYIYIRMTPRFRSLINQSSLLNTYIPCDFTYNWRWEVLMYDKIQ